MRWHSAPIRPRWVTALLVAAFVLSVAHHGVGQFLGSGIPNPRLSTLVPAGGKAGTVVEVSWTGLDLEEPQALLFSHPGIKGEAIQPPPPPPPDPKKPPAKPAPKPPVTKFKVTIAADVPIGFHDARFVNSWGVSNPRAFVVGDLPEAAEKEPNNEPAQAQKVEINTTVHGVVTPSTDVDYYAFTAKKGQRVIISCLTSSIDSRLNPEIQVFDALQRKLAYGRNYRDNDALVDVAVPADGDYYVRLCEFTHIFGSADHFYRLTISTTPWIDAVYPPMIEPGKPTQVTLYGRNLPGGTLDPNATAEGRSLEKAVVTITPPADPQARERLVFSGRITPLQAGLDGFEYRVKNAAGLSNPVLITYADAGVVLDNEKNDSPETAQEINVPCEIAGRIEKLQDKDYYSFSAKKGDIHVIEAFCDRLGSPADLYFSVRKPDTKQELGEFDDNADTLSPTRFYTRSDDPQPFRFVVPADGKYQLLVTTRDASTRAGPRQVYRVRIAPERPDFRLIVMPPADSRPDACCIRQGGQQFYNVFVWRRDGFTGEVALTVEGLPKGVSCPPQIVSTGIRQAGLVLNAAPDAPIGHTDLKIKGTATINGKPVIREARPAAITWQVQPQQNIPTITRLDRQLLLAVRDKAPFMLTAAVDKAELVQGAKANVTLKLKRLWPDLEKQTFTVTVLVPNPNLTLNNNQPLQMPAGKDDLPMPLEVKTGLPPGAYTIVLRATAPVPFSKDPMAKQKPNINVVQPATPVTINVLPQFLANLSVGNATTTLKIGTQAEVVVKVARLHGYAGEFKVKLELPPTAKGVTADEVTIPAGKDEAKFIVRAAQEMAPLNLPNVVLKATGMYNGKVPTTQEAKLSINVVK